MGVIMPDNRFRYSKDVDSFPSRGLELDLPRLKTFKQFSRKNMLSEKENLATCSYLLVLSRMI